jgi:hypothetical protein
MLIAEKTNKFTVDDYLLRLPKPLQLKKIFRSYPKYTFMLKHP